MSTATAATKTAAKGSRKLPFPIDIVPSDSADTASNSDPTDPVAKTRADIAEVRRFHHTSNRSVIEAVARSFCIHLAAAANPNLRAWQESEIDGLNSEIEKHNDGLKLRRERAKSYAEGTLKKDDWVYGQGNGDQEKEAIAKEVTQLSQDASLSADDWATLRKVPIDQRDKANSYTRHTKHVFGFDREADAAMVSRYATAHSWIGDRPAGQTLQSHDDIVRAIDAAGGFEAVLRAQRNKNSGGGNSSGTGNSQPAVNIDDVRDAVSTAKAMATVPVPLRHAEGLVLVLGRYANGNLEVVRTIPMPDPELNKLLVRYPANDE